MSPRSSSRVGSILRTIAWALFFAFAFGFLVGTWIRSQLDEPVRYIGDRDRPELRPALSPALVLTTGPGNVSDAETCIFVACQHEEKIG